MLNALRERSSTYFDDLRAKEFGRLEEGRAVYLDHAGSALYGDSQLRAHHELLRSSLFGNPHSDSGPSRTSTFVIEEARRLVLRFLGVDDSTHVVCFTANATAAIKLVAESYPFGEARPLILSADNHNSVNGIREFAARAGARVEVIAVDDQLRLHEAERALASESDGLFAFPAQSNFSGVRHALSLVGYARARGLQVLLDAAAYLPTHALDLSEVTADFTVLSFYKLFGYPTGLGALVARRDALATLRRPWFSGGTVTYASVAADTHRLHDGAEAFEDGTPDFLSIAALPAGFALLEEVGMTRLAEHTAALAGLLLGELADLRHASGTRAVRIYGPAGHCDRGATVSFNVCGPSGEVVSYASVEERARERGVSLRGGCFCNPGAAEAALRLDAAQVRECLARLDGSFSPERFSNCLGSAVGAVRISIGMANNREDIERAVNVIASFPRMTGRCQASRPTAVHQQLQVSDRSLSDPLTSDR